MIFRVSPGTFVLRALLMCIAAGMAALAAGQDGQQWTERRNLGFEGQVRSVLTTVERRSPDPRAPGKRALFLRRGPEWFLFDRNGKRIESASASDSDQIIDVSKRTEVKADGTEVWTNSKGEVSESRRQEILLPDGRREVTYYSNSKVANREVIRFDKKGREVELRGFNSKGSLISEQSTAFSEQGEMRTWKLYDEDGAPAQEIRTSVPVDESRIDRWQYDAEGRLAWHVAINGEGELLTYWYAPGYVPKLSSSGSLGVCHPGACVSYKFDERGGVEKTVQHTRGKAYLEPESEEHYNGVGEMDEKAEVKYNRDSHGNWILRSVLLWDAFSNLMIEVEQDSRKIEYY